MTTKTIFNRSNANRIETMTETIKSYENTMNVLNDLLKEKEEEEKQAFNQMVRSETTLMYFFFYRCSGKILLRLKLGS